MPEPTALPAFAPGRAPDGDQKTVQELVLAAQRVTAELRGHSTRARARTGA